MLSENGQPSPHLRIVRAGRSLAAHLVAKVTKRVVV
jgi:hypothetical protein